MKNILIQISIIVVIILSVLGLTVVLQDKFAFGEYNGINIELKKEIPAKTMKTAVDNAIKDKHKGYSLKKIQTNKEYQLQTKKALTDEEKKQLHAEIGKLDLKAKVSETLIYPKDTALTHNYDIYLINFLVIILVTVVFDIITKRISSKM